MTIEEADRFIADIRSNPAAFEGLEELARSGDTVAVYEQVRSMGYDATQTEISEAFLEYVSDELDENQLAAVAGGLSDGAAIGIGAGVAVGVGAGAGAVVAGVVIATSSAAAAGAAI